MNQHVVRLLFECMPPLHVLLEDSAIHCFALFKRPPNLSDASSGRDQCCAECQTNQLHCLCLASFSKTIQAKQRGGCPKCALSFVVGSVLPKADTCVLIRADYQKLYFCHPQ